MKIEEAKEHFVSKTRWKLSGTLHLQRSRNMCTTGKGRTSFSEHSVMLAAHPKRATIGEPIDRVHEAWHDLP